MSRHISDAPVDQKNAVAIRKPEHRNLDAGEYVLWKRTPTHMMRMRVVSTYTTGGSLCFVGTNADDKWDTGTYYGLVSDTVVDTTEQ